MRKHKQPFYVMERIPGIVLRKDLPALIHNDYKFDNVVLDPEDPLNIIGVLDWEMTTLGDPMMDLGGTWPTGSRPMTLKRCS